MQQLDLRRKEKKSVFIILICEKQKIVQKSKIILKCLQWTELIIYKHTYIHITSEEPYLVRIQPPVLNNRFHHVLYVAKFSSWTKICPKKKYLIISCKIINVIYEPLFSNTSINACILSPWALAIEVVPVMLYVYWSCTWLVRAICS